MAIVNIALFLQSWFLSEFSFCLLPFSFSQHAILPSLIVIKLITTDIVLWYKMMNTPKVKAQHKDIEIFAYFWKEQSIPFLMTDWSNRFMPLLLASSTDCEDKNITIQIDWILKNCIHKSCHSKREFLLFPFILIRKGGFIIILIISKSTEKWNSLKW